MIAPIEHHPFKITIAAHNILGHVVGPIELTGFGKL